MVNRQTATAIQRRDSHRHGTLPEQARTNLKVDAAGEIPGKLG
jgi:hypothetical protein